MTVCGYELSFRPEIFNLGLIGELQVASDPPENTCRDMCLSVCSFLQRICSITQILKGIQDQKLLETTGLNQFEYLKIIFLIEH